MKDEALQKEIDRRVFAVECIRKYLGQVTQARLNTRDDLKRAEVKVRGAQEGYMEKKELLKKRDAECSRIKSYLEAEQEELYALTERASEDTDAEPTEDIQAEQGQEAEAAAG